LARHQWVNQQGAALLMAMLTVALVATLAAAGVWLQWRSIEVEAAERQRAQAHWLLLGALDWARIILREDARSGGDNGPDHLAEPWAVPLQEARLSTFVSSNAEGVSRDDERVAEEVFLSGQISDLQGRLNVLNLVESDGQLSPSTLAVFERLFKRLDLPPTELQTLAQQLVLAHGNTAARPLRPQRVEQLAWLGLSASSLAALAPHVCVLPVRTSVNLNTASEAVLQVQMQRMASGKGAHMEVALSEAAHYLALPRNWGLTTAKGSVGGSHAGYRVYPCKDGRVAFAALEPHFAQRLMQAAGQSDSDVRSMSRPEAHAAVATFAKDKTRLQLDALSVAKDIPLFTLKG
jgi:general secretion pathway protein K